MMYPKARDIDRLQDKRNRMIRQMLGQGKSTKEIIETVNALVEEPRITVPKIKTEFYLGDIIGKNQNI